MGTAFAELAGPFLCGGDARVFGGRSSGWAIQHFSAVWPTLPHTWTNRAGEFLGSLLVRQMSSRGAFFLVACVAKPERAVLPQVSSSACSDNRSASPLLLGRLPVVLLGEALLRSRPPGCSVLLSGWMWLASLHADRRSPVAVHASVLPFFGPLTSLIGRLLRPSARRGPSLPTPRLAPPYIVRRL